MSRCTYCRKRNLAVNSRGKTMSHCGKDVCRRAHDAARKRRQRARGDEATAAPAIDPTGPVDTPFGMFESARAAWEHVFGFGCGAANTVAYEDAIEWLDENVPTAEPPLDAQFEDWWAASGLVDRFDEALPQND